MQESQIRMPWSQQPDTYSRTEGNMPNYSDLCTAPVTRSTFESVSNLSPSNPWPLSSSDLDNLAGFDNETKRSRKEDLIYSETPFQYPNFPPSSDSNMSPDILGQPASLDGMVQPPNPSSVTKTVKRRVQNRAAQRSFRKRKQEYVETLEKQVLYLEQQLEAYKQENHCLQSLAGQVPMNTK